MQRFWGTVIEPIFELVRPGVIVEIGSDQGYNTECLLGFCRKTGARLHVIDPAPGYDPSEWRREYGERLVFHEDLSLNALPEIGGFDAVLSAAGRASAARWKHPARHLAEGAPAPLP